MLLRGELVFARWNPLKAELTVAIRAADEGVWFLLALRLEMNSGFANRFPGDGVDRLPFQDPKLLLIGWRRLARTEDQRGQQVSKQVHTHLRVFRIHRSWPCRGQRVPNRQNSQLPGFSE